VSCCGRRRSPSSPPNTPPFQPSLFDERNLLERLTSQHFPGERAGGVVFCRNPLLAEERARKRLELLAATEADLDKVVAATQRARHPAAR